MALPAYRNLLRAIRIAFEGDTPLISAAAHQSRSAFDASRSLAPTSPDAEKQIQHARDVARLLRENVVQGKKVEGDDSVYQLRIHPEIERGDNESIKNPNTGVVSPRVKCCSEK